MTDERSMTVFEKVMGRKWSFLAVFTLVYFLSLVALGSMGLTPWSSEGPAFLPGNGAPLTGGNSVAVEEGELPLRVEIPALGIRTAVVNPTSSSISVLDAELTKGAVRYPGSGIPGEEGNVLIFGHSSHLPVVHNQAYRAFNDIQKLREGDVIYVIGKENAYIYAVESVEEATTESDAVPLAVDGAKLTLATCNNFGSKEDRFIVVASLVKIDPLSE
jgi:LPXTG-site transpeptidase (sortase) family protein